MTSEQIIVHMKRELDWHAKEYLKYTDEGVKESIADEYRILVKGFRAILRDMYKRKPVYRVFFTGKIEKYIEMREIEDWQ